MSTKFGELNLVFSFLVHMPLYATASYHLICIEKVIDIQVIPEYFRSDIRN